MKTLYFISGFCILFQLNLIAQQAVGIGTTTPNPSAMLDVTSPFNNKGFLIPRLTTAQRNAIPSPPTGLMVFDSDYKEFLYMNGGWLRMLNSSFWNKSLTRGWLYNSTDSVGIGTSSPDEKLHVLNGKIYLQDNRTNQNPFVIFDNPNTDYKEGGLMFKRLGDTLASIKYVNNPSLVNYIKLSASESSSASNMYISADGTSIGTVDPQTTLHLRKASADELLRLESTNPMIKFRNYAGLAQYTDIGFLQTVDNDLRIGTFSSNTTGDFIIRTGGVDNVVVDQDGDVGIGTLSNPFAKLQILGGQDAGLSSSNNGYAMFGAFTSSGTNLLIDNNEIMVRTGATAAGTLTLQNNGGELAVGARTTINKNGEALKINGVDPLIQFYQSGVAKSFISQAGSELFMGVNGGNLHLDGAQVAIGAVVPAASGYKLTVTGKIICEEVKVKLVSSGWPDYVFANDYKLPKLQDVEKFIKDNKHLPDMPCAAEVEKNGLEIGDMQKKMMEKIEQLTLYVIELQKQVDDLKKNQK